MARRRRPKIQVRSTVRRALMGSRTGLRIRIRFPDKGGFAVNMGPRRRGAPTIYFRWALPRRGGGVPRIDAIYLEAVVVNNPATGLDLVDGSERSHLLSFCLF